MFILEENAFGDARLDNIAEFVNCWSQFYRDKVSDDITNERISYLDELNLGGDLTNENVRKLLRWKDPQHLTHVNKQRAPNLKVQRVLAQIEAINSFRRQEVTSSDFSGFVSQIFASKGAVYRAFLFHIARPAEYPIWDQNVARVHALLTKRNNDLDCEHYIEYRRWFAKLKKLLNIGRHPTRNNIEKAKRLDRALVAYGQFLKRYLDAVR